MKKWVVKYRKILVLIFLLVSIAYYFALPEELFTDPYSTVLESHRHELLGASIAADGQWRFPLNDSVPSKFAEALIAFEDKRFWNHPGVDIFSMGRAMQQNIKALKVVSGGSTITMQVIRLSRKNRSRTLFEKGIELVLATRLEFRYSKKEILALYAAHAPFGGNVVGLQAACWRYFGRDPQSLSWAEAAMLAVLPNAPALIHPGKNRERLKAKRDKLLDKLLKNGVLDELTCQLAKEEPVPEEPKILPRYARHLLMRAAQEGFRGKRVVSTIRLPLQIRVEQIINDHHQRLKNNQIFNAAAIILDVQSGDVLAYAGNTNTQQQEHGDDVDIITSPRSTGSTLKPFLYAAMLDEGKMLPRTLQPDVPILVSGFAPQNFSKEYDGAVAADKALIRSLNVPAVYMLRKYRYEKFHSLLHNMGMTTLTEPPDHYGLSMILGGADGTLWDLAGMYASMARTLNNYFEHPGIDRYNRKDFHAANYLANSVQQPGIPSLEESGVLSASSIYLTFQALKEVYRPGEETGWRYFSGSKPIAWKTGTSFGFRDGWAIGVTPNHVVGVWVGNADGEGRPGLTGTEAASPVMFDIFSQLPGDGWFQRPELEMQKITVCAKSGQRNTSMCDVVDTTWVSKTGLQSLPCAYHKKIHLSPDKKNQVTSECERIDKMVTTNWFVLPPVQEYYFRTKNLSYKTLPPFKPGCLQESHFSSMDLIYPKSGSRIYIPRELDGAAGNVIFELAHRNPGTTVYWHLDGQYIGSTKKVHHMALNPGRGKHIIALVDEQGAALERDFEVISGL
ncbi:MAG: penicillin-binding protein 1C [Bacteroidota bacterium]